MRDVNFDQNQDAIQELGYLLAEAAKNVIFVVGAGLSRPAGIPGWVGLVEKLRAAVVTHATETLAPEPRGDLIARIEASQDLWIRTKIIKKALPSLKYETAVRDTLTPSAQLASRADSYGRIWKLRPSGVISLNLDSLALAATPDSIHATAESPERYGAFLLATRPFLFQPHGELKTPSSWVLELDARNRLLGSPHYRRFMNALLTSRRLVFVGVGPRDIALEAILLDDFRQQMTSTGLSHFWITDQCSVDDTEWAESFNIKQVLYEKDRHEAVGPILEHLSSFRPRDATPPLAYDGPELDPTFLPPDEELMRQSTEDIRRKLNASLAHLRSNSQSNSYADGIGSFLRNYPKSIHMAWLVGDDNASTKLIWGTKLEKHLGYGAFANVWLVTDVVDGTKWAVKVLQEQVLRSEGFIDAFRNGVHAMRILGQHNVPGMCRMRAAFDIPACIVMEYIEGPDLEALVADGHVLGLAELVKIVRNVAEIVQRGHDLPERVLHRDLKPANVMLRDHWLPNTETEVIVLDFDLSWYEGAMGKSMVAGAAKLHNYIAPEQQEKGPFSRRHTAVDVFGVSMLLFYVAVGRHPVINEQERASFRNDIIAETGKYSSLFPGLPELLADLIIAGASRNQPSRPGLRTFIDRLKLIERIVSVGVVEVGSVLVCALASQLRGLGWTLDSELAWFDTNSVRLRMGPCVTEVSITAGEQLALKFVATDTGQSDRKNIGKYLKKRGEECAAGLKRSRLIAQAQCTIGQGLAEVKAMTRLSSKVSGVDAVLLANDVDAAARKLAFD